MGINIKYKILCSRLYLSPLWLPLLLLMAQSIWDKSLSMLMVKTLLCGPSEITNGLKVVLMETNLSLLFTMTELIFLLSTKMLITQTISTTSTLLERKSSMMSPSEALDALAMPPSIPFKCQPWITTEMQLLEMEETTTAMPTKLEGTGAQKWTSLRPTSTSLLLLHTSVTIQETAKSTGTAIEVDVELTPGMLTTTC